MSNNRLMTYAFNADRKLVHIDSVNGLQCKCFCPGCGESLIAKNEGKIKQHHFAHKYEGECTSGYMTMVHMLAEAIIFNNGLIPCPWGASKAVKVGTEIRIEELNIIPDIFAYVSVIVMNQAQCSIPVIVEIYVTHKVDDEKLGIIQKAGIPAVEIDLSKVEFTTIENLTQEIYNTKNWKVLNSKVSPNFLPQRAIKIPLSYLRSLFPRYPQQGYQRNQKTYSRYRRRH